MRAAYRGLSGSVLTLELLDGASDQEFSADCLVEADCEHMLYLGQLYNREERTLVIGVEHAIDRQVLAAIQSSWAAAE